MNQSISLSQILADLHLIGYTEHFYLHDEVLHYEGTIVDKVHSWIHCHWHDAATDETIAIYCCIVDNVKGVFII